MITLQEGQTIFVDQDEEDVLVDDPYMFPDTKQVPGIYMIINTKIPTKWYIGSSCKLRKRANEHRAGLRANKHPNVHLQNAWNRDGENYFKFGCVEFCDKDKLIEREQYWLDRLKPEYNIVLIANQVCNNAKSVIHKENLSKALKGRCVGNAFLESQKTHCPHGHEYTKENTYIQISRNRKGRVCKICKLARDKKRYNRKKENNG